MTRMYQGIRVRSIFQYFRGDAHVVTALLFSELGYRKRYPTCLEAAHFLGTGTDDYELQVQELLSERHDMAVAAWSK